MDLYGNKVSFAQNTSVSARALTPRVVAFDPSIIGPFGCAPCTSGDSPLWDIEQQFNGGY